MPQGSVTLLAGGKYWLVIERSGSIDLQNGYWIGLDENLGFETGSMLLFNGSSWLGRSPDADLLFRVVGRKTLARQISDLVEFAGQFLNGVDTSQIEGLALPLFFEGESGLSAFLFLICWSKETLGCAPLVRGTKPPHAQNPDLAAAQPE